MDEDDQGGDEEKEEEEDEDEAEEAEDDFLPTSLQSKKQTHRAWRSLQSAHVMIQYKTGAQARVRVVRMFATPPRTWRPSENLRCTQSKCSEPANHRHRW